MNVTADLLSFLKSHGATGADARAAEYVLTVYLDDAESNPSKRHGWRETLRQFVRAERARLADAPAMLDPFERCLTTLEARLPNLHAEVNPEHAAVPGWMLLYTASGDVIEARLSTAPPVMLRWEPCAMLLPYLEATQAEDAIVVLIDLEHVTIARVQRGMVHEVDAVRADTTVEVGSHMGDRLLAATRRKLAVIAGTDARIVVGGASVSVAHLVAMLPSELAARCVVADGLYLHTPFAQIPPIAHDALIGLLSRRQLDLLATLNRQAHLTRHAAFGLDAIAAASAAGAIERLLVTHTLWTARSMDVEQLCQRAIRSGACVQVTAGAATTSLDDLGGIAAELRFVVAA